MIKYELQIASLKQEDAKKELERRLLVAMQDNAIAQMTIGDLEQRLEKRSKMFEGMRLKVEDDLKKDNAIRQEHFADELQNAQNKIGELESCCSTQKQTIFQLNSNERVNLAEIERLNAQNQTLSNDFVSKTSGQGSKFVACKV